MKMIVASNRRRVIGLKGGIPWKCKEDLEHFKKMTMGCTLLVGYNTAQTLPELPGRTIIVDERDKEVDVSKIDWCIGGRKTYNKYAKYFTEIHWSIIENDKSIGDVHLPRLKGLPKDCEIFTYYFCKK